MSFRERKRLQFLRRGDPAAVWPQAALPLVLLLTIVAAMVFAQQAPTAASPHEASGMQPVGHGAAGYLIKDDLPDFLQVLPPVPMPQSEDDNADVTLLQLWRRAENSPRWQLAKADAELSYSRFAEAYGADIDPAKTPLLFHLLERVEADVSGPLGQAKEFYHRPRPYQRFPMEHVCGFTTTPSPDPVSQTGNSYPSGHSVFGWTTALVLAEVAPDRAQTILARAREYGESRIVCAAHFPSDVLGGQLLTAAVFSRLHAVADYNRDLHCAQQERAIALKTKEQLSPECLAAWTSLTTKP